MFTSLLLALCPYAPTQPDTLGTAEVTAARRVAGISAPAPVQRIDSAAITLRGITDMGDAMRRLAGVNLRDYGGAGGLKTVSVRGLGAGHTAVAYDGLCINDSRQGQIDIGQFSLSALSAVELTTLDAERLLCPVRNLAQAVVNLTSLKPSAQDDFKLHGGAKLEQASFMTWSPSLNLSKRLTSRATISTVGHYFFAHNDYPFVVENGVATEHLRRNNSRMQTATAEVNWLQQLAGGGSLTTKAYFTHNYRHLPGMVLYYVNDNNERLLEQTAFAQTRWEQSWGRWSAYAAAKQSWQTSQYCDIDAKYPDGAFRQHYWQRESYVTAGAQLAILPTLLAAYATDYAHTGLNSNLKTDNRVSRDTWLQALSLALRLHRLQITARATYNRYWNQARSGSSARDANRITPSITASAQLLRARDTYIYMRAGYKESFRMPTFTESYYYHLGSTTLRPELTRQFSAGLTAQMRPAPWWKTLALTADVYSSRVKDRIVSIPYNLFVWHTVNLSDVRSLGIDLTLQSDFAITARQNISLNANYSWIKSADHTSPTLSTWHKQLAYTPPHSGASSVAWLNPWANLTLHTTFASRRWCTNNHLPTTDLPAYSEWGFALFRTFSLSRGIKVDLRADLLNAFDHRYEVIRRYPMPGRAYKLTIGVKF